MKSGGRRALSKVSQRATAEATILIKMLIATMPGLCDM